MKKLSGFRRNWHRISQMSNSSQLCKELLSRMFILEVLERKEQDQLLACSMKTVFNKTFYFNFFIS